MTLDPEQTMASLRSHPFQLRDSLEGIRFKPVIRHCLHRYTNEVHDIGGIRRLVVHVDGGGTRVTAKRGILPATWAVLISSVDDKGTMAFFRFATGSVCTDPKVSITLVPKLLTL